MLVFLAAYFIPFDHPRVKSAVIEMFTMLQDYAHKHVLLCLVPAFFIAGAISVFISQAAVMKYLGSEANKVVAYGVASVSGAILAVCSCTVLPLFAGIYKMGAGLGPASSFLYSGPAINVLAIVMTAKILGWKIGLARALGAILFSVVVGVLMAWTFKNDEIENKRLQAAMPVGELKRTLLQDSIYFFSMVGILVFANWAPPELKKGIWHWIFTWKWWITGGFGLIFSVVLILWFAIKPLYILITAVLTFAAAWYFPSMPLIAFSIGVVGLIIASFKSTDETRDWMSSTWTFAGMILPLLFFGVLAAGFLLGMPGSDNGIIPGEWIAKLVGGNSLMANFLASFIGALMYFATLTEVPILQGLIGAGMGNGPALALLLAGPALSLPNMLVIRSVLGTKKTLFFVSYIVILSTLAGYIFGFLTEV